MARSIYAKGFGPEQSTTQYDIEAFFAEYGTTRSVRLRRTFDKMFKGSVFVEFDTEETAKQFLDKAKAGQVKWHGPEGGKDLKIMSKKSYCDDKVEEIRKGNIRKHSPQRSRANRGDDDNRDWRTRRDEDRKNGFRGGARGGGRGGRSGGDRRGGGGSAGGRVDSERRNGQRTSPPMVRSTLKDEEEVKGQQGKDDAKDSGEPAATAGTVEAAMEKSVDAATLSSAAAPAPAPAPESKKRAREDDEDDGDAVKGGQASKKIDLKEAAAT